MSACAPRSWQQVGIGEVRLDATTDVIRTETEMLHVEVNRVTQPGIWYVFATLEALIDRSKLVVPRCLTRKQREDAFLNPEPPR
jgi:hypothetical protein